jgi:hypothetical protein
MTSQETSVLQSAVNWARAWDIVAKAEKLKNGHDEAIKVLSEAEVELYAAVFEWRGLMVGESVSTIVIDG